MTTRKKIERLRFEYDYKDFDSGEVWHVINTPSNLEIGNKLNELIDAWNGEGSTPKDDLQSKRDALWDDLWDFHLAHPELRVWQALAAWAEKDRVVAVRAGGLMEDTFYWETKDGK